jgi:hypothetical protein
MTEPTGNSLAQMKICLYCGRHNPLQASVCEGCGASQFEVEPLPAPPTWQTIPPSLPVRVEQINPAARFLYFFFIGLIVSFYWLALTLIIFVTVVGWPLASAMLKVLPTAATLYRSPHYAPGDALRSGWTDTIVRYRAAPLTGKVFAPLVFALCLLAIIYLMYGQ